MYNRLKGVGWIAFSDPAGAKACLGLATILKVRYNNIQVKLFSNRQFDFYSDWDIPVLLVDGCDSDFSQVKPDWIFTGTSHPESSSGFELEFLKYAQAFHIPSWSFVDHWTEIGLRFKTSNSYVFPQTVIVLDEKARYIAIDEGVPARILLIHSNPYLDYINQLWQPNTEAQTLFNDFKKRNDFSKAILYAPDPLSLRNEDSFWGFNESTALKDILEVIGDKKDLVVLIRKHPLQPNDILEMTAEDSKEYGNQVIFVSEFKNLELMYYADIIIGFHSNFLLEANALGKKIIRYYPSSIKKDPIAHLHVGEVTDSKEKLKNLIMNKLRHE